MTYLNSKIIACVFAAAIAVGGCEQIAESVTGERKDDPGTQVPEVVLPATEEPSWGFTDSVKEAYETVKEAAPSAGGVLGEQADTKPEWDNVFENDN